MTRHLLIASACVAALSLGACNKNKAAENNAMTNTTATNAAETNTLPNAHPGATVLTPSNETAAPDYLTKTVNANMLEIEASKVALQRATNADVKAFAKQMVADHTKAADTLKKALTKAKLNLTPPTQLPSDLAEKVNDLKTADAKDFDKKYMDHEVDIHQDALDLQTRYAKDGDNADLKAYAAKMATAIQDHLTKAKSIRDALKS